MPSQNSNLSVIIFDLDQTLVDRTATFGNFLKDLYQTYLNQSKVSYLEFENLVTKLDNNGYSDKQETFKNVVSTLNLPNNLVEEFWKFYLDNYGQKPVLFASVTETLKRLSKDFKLAIISNGKTLLQTRKLENSHITKYFDVISISQDFGVKKPDPIIFIKTLEKLQVKPEQTACVGDNPDNDIFPAIKLGMKAIWVKNPHYPEPKNCLIITDISQLTKKLFLSLNT